MLQKNDALTKGIPHAVLLDEMAEHDQQDAKTLQLVNIIAALRRY